MNRIYLSMASLSMAASLLLPACTNQPDSPSNGAFPIDSHTVAYYDFEDATLSLDKTGNGKWSLVNATLGNGFAGRGLICDSGKDARLDTVFADGTPEGSIELYIQPVPGFDPAGSYSIIGTNGSRCNLFYSRGNLYFLKNHDGIFKTCAAPVPLGPGKWRKIAATWGSKGMRLFVGDSLVAQNGDTTNYRNYAAGGLEYTTFYVGRKSTCCLEAVGISPNQAGFFYWPGGIDEIRFSDIQRY